MNSTIKDIERVAMACLRRMRAWVARPFDSWYRWGIPVLLFAAFCAALPAWVGLALFLPLSVALSLKTACAMRRIHNLELVDVVERNGVDELDTDRDRVQRAWVLSCGSIVAATVFALIVRAVLSLFPGVAIPSTLATYLAFAAVLMGGFLLFYFLALRFDGAFLRGMASVSVTLPAFFIIVAVASMLLSWVMSVVQDWGLSAETMLAGGFSWLYQVQSVLKVATDYFLQQDPLIVGASIVFAALLLLLYTYTVPQYWMGSVRWWLKGMGLAAAVFSGAAIVFAGVWVSDVQQWVASSEGRALDASLLGGQAAALSSYRREDMIALVRALVLPYTVGVFVANAVLAWRRAVAKEKSDAILDGFAESGRFDERKIPQIRKRYLYYCGNRVLWDVAMRSIGRDVPLPHPFAPRKLTLKERLTGELDDAAGRGTAS